MAAKITENHRIVTYEHEMNAEDHRLTEKKQKTVIENKNIEDPESSEVNVTTILVHLRKIDERSVTVTETTRTGQDEPERVVETTMSEEENLIFESDWNRLWTPQLNDQSLE